jgi:hypothetical protein
MGVLSIVSEFHFAVFNANRKAQDILGHFYWWLRPDAASAFYRLLEKNIPSVHSFAARHFTELATS